MSDSSFPKSLDYSPDPLAISARSYEAVCVPESSTTALPSTIVRIRIPSGRAGTYLNPAKSFLAFTFNNTTPSIISDGGSPDYRANSFQRFYIDGSAYAVLQTMEIYNSSNLLESIQNYNLLMNIFMDLQISMGSRLTSGTILGMGHTGIISDTAQTHLGQYGPPGWSKEAIPGFETNSINVAEYWERTGNTFADVNLYTGFNMVVSIDSAAANSIANDRVLRTTGADAANVGCQTRRIVLDADLNNLFYGAPPVGTRGTASSTMNILVSGAGEDQFETQNTYNNSKSCAYGGQNGWISRLGPCVPYGQSMRFCLPLVSGVIGTLNCKLFPLNALNSDLILNLTLASNGTVACNNYIPSHWNPTDQGAGTAGDPWVGATAGGGPTSSPAYTLSEIEYHANIVEISANAQQMIDIATNGQYIIPSSSYRNFTATYQSGQTNNEFQVPARFTSLKSLLACQRDTNNLNQPSRFSLTGRIKNYMTRIQYRVGSLLVPPQPMRMENRSVLAPYADGGGASEVFCHLLEAIGQSASDLDLEVGLNNNIFAANNDCDYQDNNAANAFNLVNVSALFDALSDKNYYERLAEGSKAGFCWGIDTESFSNANCTGPLQSGTNCLGLNIMCRIYIENLLTGTGDSVNPSTDIVGCTVDHYAHFDMVIVVSGGVASVRF